MRRKKYVLPLFFTVCAFGAAVGAVCCSGGAYMALRAQEPVSSAKGSALVGKDIRSDGLFQPMTIEKLTDLNIPRSGHSLHVINGELTVFGGHSTGFIPTSTAEYYDKGKWHRMEMVYSHDFAASIQLSSGEVLLFGGSESPLGVGQTYFVECYDPLTHSFSPLPILDQQRSRHSAALLPDGTVVVSGNWNKEDGIATWSAVSGGEAHQIASFSRMSPHILPTGSGDALIFGSRSSFDEKIPGVVDRLHGDSFTVPLLEEWYPVMDELDRRTEDWLVDDSSDGGYDYLITAESADGHAGIMRITGESFSLLELERPLPSTGIGGDIVRWLPLFVGRDNQLAYVPGVVTGTRSIYLACVEYGKALGGGKAPVTFFQTRLDDDATLFPENIVLLSGGRIGCVGGSLLNDYVPSSEAYIFHTVPPSKKVPLWWKAGLAVLLLALAVLLLVHFFGKRKSSPDDEGIIMEPDPVKVPDNPMNKLMARITTQMEVEHLFLKPGLTKDDVARAVGSNSRYVSDCINSVAGCSFIDYINGYRIRYAQRLLYENPDMRLSEISEESGFSSEITFYRNFKARTGLTPGEWISSQNRR